MAYQPKGYFRKLPKDVHDVLAEAGERKLSTTATYKYLKKKKVKVVTPISEIRKLAKKASKKDCPVVINNKQIDRYYPKADGLAREFYNNKYKVELHPILKYNPKSYIKDVIHHELDHVKVFRKRNGVQKPKA